MRKTYHLLLNLKSILYSAGICLIFMINLFPPECLVFLEVRDFHATNLVEILFHFHRNTSYIAAVHRIPAIQY